MGRYSRAMTELPSPQAPAGGGAGYSTAPRPCQDLEAAPVGPLFAGHATLAIHPRTA